MAQRLGTASGEQIQHGGVSGDHQLPHRFRRKPCLVAGFCQQCIDGIGDLLPQQLSLTRQSGTNAAHHIGGNAPLGIHGSHGGEALSLGQVIELQGQGGGADVHGGAVPFPGGSLPAFLAGELNIIFLGVRQPYLPVPLHNGLTGQAGSGALFCLIGGGHTALYGDGAFAADTSAAAGLIHRAACLSQERLHQGGLFKVHFPAGSILPNGQSVHSAYSVNSTIPK